MKLKPRIKMKINNKFTYSLLITTLVFLSIFTLHLTAHASSLFRVYSLSMYTGESVINLPLLHQTNSSATDTTISHIMNSLNPFSSPGISSISFDEVDKGNYISSGGVASAPEPVALLLIGIGLMGVALYRRLKNK